MKRYPQALTAPLTAWLLAPHPASVAALAHATPLPQDTLSGGRAAALGRVNPAPAPAPAPP